MAKPGAFGAKVEGARRERVHASPRWTGRRFENVLPTRQMKEGSAGAVAKFLFRRGRRTPTGQLPMESPLAAWARPAESGLRATWLGHSTMLLELDGARVL